MDQIAQLCDLGRPSRIIGPLRHYDKESELPDPRHRICPAYLRACVTKRKISGGTMSAEGRQARDVMLGLMKTCRKLDLSFFAYFGARLGCSDSADPPPPLANLVAGAAA